MFGFRSACPWLRRLFHHTLLYTCTHLVLTPYHFRAVSCAVQIMLDEELEDVTNGKGVHSKLSQAVSQRWVSICKMLHRVLERWDAIGKVYLVNNEVFPLGKNKDEVCLVVVDFSSL